MLFSCMTLLRRLSFATSKLSHVCCDIPWTKSGKPGSKRFADHRPFEIVGTVCRSNYITSDEVRETLSEMSYHGNPQTSFSNRKMHCFCRCPHLNHLEPTKDVGAYMATANCCAATVTSMGDSGHRRLSTH